MRPAPSSGEVAALSRPRRRGGGRLHRRRGGAPQPAALRPQGIHAVVGTTGLVRGRPRRHRRSSSPSAAANAIVAANFAIGAVLLLRFCRSPRRTWTASRSSSSITTPSVTRRRERPCTRQPRSPRPGRRRAAARCPPIRPTELVLAGARGGEAPGGVHIHSVRLPGLVAHEEVIFGAPGQSLTIRHDSYDRRSFMPGVLLAVRAVAAGPV